MATGFRGGRGRGVGRGGRGGRIGRVPWEHDPELVIDNEPQDLFSRIDIPLARPPSQVEKAQVEQFRRLRAIIHCSPLHTTTRAPSKSEKKAATDPERFDPFGGMPSYTQRYKFTGRSMPELSKRTFDIRLFPPELRAVIAPKRKRAQAATSRAKRPNTALHRSASTIIHGLNEFDEGEGDGEDQPDADGEKIDVHGRDDDRSEADPEDDFSDDEDDMADDYNAEKYFDDGEGDDDDGDGDDPGYD